MRLTSVEVIPYALPFRRPYVTARGTLTQREMVLLRLTTDEGLIGLGEAVPLSLRGGVTIEQVVRELREADESEALHDLIKGGHLDYSFAEMIDPRLTLSLPSQAAVLGALDDLRAQLDWDPDEDGRLEVRCNATLVAGSPAAVAADAVEWAEEGFTTFKLKLGTGEDLEQVRAVRAAVGSEAQIRVDANAAWSAQTAARLLNELEPFDVELAEQPVATMAEAAELAGLTSIPLCGDESIASRDDAIEAIGLGAFAVTGIKLSKVGGLYAGLEIAETMNSYVSSALDGPVGIAAGAWLAASVDHENALLDRPERAHGLATQRLFSTTIAAVGCELHGEMLRLSSRPGLGVVIDEDALAAHRL